MKKFLPLILLILLGFRLWLATQAKHGDMYNNLDWGRGAVTFGLRDFYELPKEAWPHSRPNQPPGSILLHAGSVIVFDTIDSAIKQLNRQIPLFPSQLVWWWETSGPLVAIKLPSILSDLAIFSALSRFGNAGLVAGLVFLLNPAMWYESSYWGQTDSVVAALSLWSLVFLSRGKIAHSATLLGLSLITKVSWAPILPFWLIYIYKNHRPHLHQIIWVAILPLLISILFHPQLDLPIWLTQLFVGRILPGESSFITVNAFNFWHLFFASDRVPGRPLVTGISLAILTLLFFICARSLWRKPWFDNLMYTLAIFFFGYFLFSTRIHERYLYPTFPLISYFLAIKLSRRITLFYLLISTLFLINIYSGWFAPKVGLLIKMYTPEFTKSISVAYLLAFAWAFELKSIYAAKK